MRQSPSAGGIERTHLKSTGKATSNSTVASCRASAGREAIKAARALLILAAQMMKLGKHAPACFAQVSVGRHGRRHSVHGAVSARLPVARRRGGAQQVGRLAQRARVQAEEPAQLLAREGRRLARALGCALRTAAS